MRAFVILAFLCFKNTVIFGQENLIRWNEKEPLQWNDFGGKVNKKSRLHAECFAEVVYRYKFNNVKGPQFDVCANFIRNTSWIKKKYQTEALLKHEQLHFDIAELFSLRIKEAFENYNYTEDFESEIKLLFNKQKLEYHAMQQRYDDETDNSTNIEKQKEWETFVANELRRMKFKQQIVNNKINAKRK